MEESEFITKVCTSRRGGWLREELVNMCNSLKISSVGNKDKLCNNIKEYYILHNSSVPSNPINDNITINNNKKFTLKDLEVNVEDGNLQIVKLLIKKETNIKYKNSALLTAAKFKHLNIIKFLIENKADIHFNNDEALMISSKNGDIDTVKYLIDNGANIHAQKEFVLQESIIGNSIVVFKYLVSLGLDIQRDNNSALKTACIRGYLEIVKYLIENGADIGIINEHMLSASLKNNNPDTVKYLIEAGANKDIIKRTILIDSAELGYFTLVKYLIEGGMDATTKNYALIYSAREGSIDIVRYLVENGADPHVENDEAVFGGVKRGYLDIVKYLLENGGDIHSRHNAFLIVAAGNGHLEVVKFLIENGINVNSQEGNALIFSIENKHNDVVKYLLKNGADIHVQDDYILTANIENDNFEMVKFAIENGVTVSKSKIDLSKKLGYTEITNFLIKSRKAIIKKTVNTIHNKVINDKYYYKWQKMCSTLDNKNLLELQDLSILHNISITDKSKRQLCKDLAIQYEQELINFDTSKCHNEYTILGDPVNLIPKPLLYSLKEGNQVYCFNIIELIEMINKGDIKNPFTRILLPIDDIKKRMLILRQTLIEDKLSLVNILDEIKNNKIMSSESILKLQIVNLIALLNYTPNADIIANINQSQINLMFNYLNENPLTKIYGEHTKSNLIMESLRILNIDDSNTNTRKAAYEIYLNELFK